MGWVTHILRTLYSLTCQVQQREISPSLITTSVFLQEIPVPACGRLTGNRARAALHSYDKRERWWEREAAARGGCQRSDPPQAHARSQLERFNWSWFRLTVQLKEATGAGVALCWEGSWLRY